MDLRCVDEQVWPNCDGGGGAIVVLPGAGEFSRWTDGSYGHHRSSCPERAVRVAGPYHEHTNELGQSQYLHRRRGVTPMNEEHVSGCRDFGG